MSTAGAATTCCSRLQVSQGACCQRRESTCPSGCGEHTSQAHEFFKCPLIPRLLIFLSSSFSLLFCSFSCWKNFPTGRRYLMAYSYLKVRYSKAYWKLNECRRFVKIVLTSLWRLRGLTFLLSPKKLSVPVVIFSVALQFPQRRNLRFLLQEEVTIDFLRLEQGVSGSGCSHHSLYTLSLNLLCFELGSYALNWAIYSHSSLCLKTRSLLFL